MTSRKIVLCDFGIEYFNFFGTQPLSDVNKYHLTLYSDIVLWCKDIKGVHIILYDINHTRFY